MQSALRLRTLKQFVFAVVGVTLQLCLELEQVDIGGPRRHHHATSPYLLCWTCKQADPRFDIFYQLG